MTNFSFKSRFRFF